jgi:hypothetical protein
MGDHLRLIALNDYLAPITAGDHCYTATAATDDRCANFSASTCPTQPSKLTASSTAVKLPLEKFHRLLDLDFGVSF